MHSTSSSEIKPSCETCLLPKPSVLQACSNKLFAANRLTGDIGANLHMIATQRLAVQHRIVTDYFVYLQGGNAATAGDFFDELTTHIADFVLCP